MSLFGDLRRMNPFSGPSVSGINNFYPSKTLLSNEWILYLMVAIFIVAVLYMLMGRTIDWKWVTYVDPRPANWKILGRGKLLFAPGPQYTNMIVPANKALPNMDDTTYSMNFEFILYDSRNYGSTEGPYRHIVHRGSDELAKATVGGALLGGCTTNTSGEAPPFGLPKRLNPGVFLDPNTNDILIFVDTTKGAETFRESLRISDIPLDSPMRIGIVMTKRVLEVYLNCRLEATKILQGEPKHVENEWYAIAGNEGVKGQVQNLYVWNEPLITDDMKELCPGIPKFAVKRPMCSGADEPIPKNTDIANAKPVSFGIEQALSKC